MRKFLYAVIIVCGYIGIPGFLFSQSTTDSLLSNASLPDCIHYALAHQPRIKQAFLDEDITERTIRSKLAEWYPQLNLGYNLQHYLELPTSFFPDLSNPASGTKTAAKTGVINTSSIALGATQTIFNKDVLLASKTADAVRLQSKQTTSDTKITLIVNVSKAYYDVLLTNQQLKLLDEDIARLEKNLKDAYSQFQSGITDKIDYKRATISLNNSKAQHRQTEELVKSKYAALKQLMGYPGTSDLQLTYDSVHMAQEASLDTTLAVNYDKRIEYQLLQTQMRLQNANVSYYKWGFLPSVSAFFNYNLAYLNDHFSDLYAKNYPNSLYGLNLSLPLFQGTQRLQNLRSAELQVKRLDWDITALKDQVNTEYVQSMSAYKGNLNQWYVLKDNVQVALEVYNTVKLQYNEGIKTYLEVIQSETDLRSAQVNYLNALYELLSSKLDVQKALGLIAPNQ